MYPFLGYPFNPTTSLSIICCVRAAQQCRFTAALEYQYIGTYVCLHVLEYDGENDAVYGGLVENVCLSIQNTTTKTYIYVMIGIQMTLLSFIAYFNHANTKSIQLRL